MSRWIKVSNLPLYYDEGEAKEMFVDVGPMKQICIEQAHLLFKSTAFIEFTNSRNARLAASTKDQTVFGDGVIKVQVIWNRKETLTTLKVANLPPKITKHALSECLSQYGEVVDISMKSEGEREGQENGSESNIPANTEMTAWVTFARVDSALRAFQQLNHSIVTVANQSSRLQVTLVNPDIFNEKWKRNIFEFTYCSIPPKRANKNAKTTKANSKKSFSNSKRNMQSNTQEGVNKKGFYSTVVDKNESLSQTHPSLIYPTHSSSLSSSSTLSTSSLPSSALPSYHNETLRANALPVFSNANANANANANVNTNGNVGAMTMATPDANAAAMREMYLSNVWPSHGYSARDQVVMSHSGAYFPLTTYPVTTNTIPTTFRALPQNFVTSSVNYCGGNNNANCLSPGLSLFSVPSIPNSPNVQPLLPTDHAYFISHPSYNAMTATTTATATTTTTMAAMPVTKSTSMMATNVTTMKAPSTITTPLSTSGSANGMASNPLSSNLNLLAINQMQSLSNIRSGTPKSIISSTTTVSQSLTDYSNTNSDAKTNRTGALKSKSFQKSTESVSSANSETSSSLSSVVWSDKQREIGNAIYRELQPEFPTRVAKLTGMLLSLPSDELGRLLADSQKLKARAHQFCQLLDNSKSRS